MKLNQSLFSGYKKLMTTMSLRTCYHQKWDFMHNLFCTLQNTMPDHDFYARIVENSMNFLYFQITDQR